MIHQYKLNGYNIVIDINSGAIHSVDSETYNIISNYKEGNFEGIDKETLNEVLPEIKALEKEGKLFSEDLFSQKATKIKDKQSVIKAMCLHVAHSCNMDCEYCFAGKGEYGSNEGLMSYEVGKKAIDFLIENSKERKNLEIDFFGGEPLLNWEVVKKLVEYARTLEEKNNKQFRFTLTTNGLLLSDEVIGFLNKEMSNVVISLDGRKEVNDKMRNTKKGDGTYDLVLESFKKLVEKRGQKNYYMRGTYTRNNLDFSKDIIHMANLGFKELSIEPVVASKDKEYALKEEDLPKIFEEYEALAVEMLNRKDFNFYHYDVDLTGGPCIAKRISGCGVGTEYIAVTPEGEIYPCHQFVSEKKYLLGNVFTGINNKKAAKEFKDCNVYSHEECRNCFARLYCSGGCAANAYYDSGKVTGVYDLGCKLHKKRIECAIMMKIAEMEEGC